MPPPVAAHDLRLENDDGTLTLLQGHKHSAHAGTETLPYEPGFVKAAACLLALDPDLLLLDEPGASLDPATVGWLVDTLLHSDKTLVVSTHNLSLAAELGSRCIVLGRGGEILFDGPVKMALTGMALLEKAGLAHCHKHRHGGAEHVHVHGHDRDAACIWQ